MASQLSTNSQPPLKLTVQVKASANDVVATVWAVHVRQSGRGTKTLALCVCRSALQKAGQGFAKGPASFLADCSFVAPFFTSCLREDLLSMQSSTEHGR